MSIAAFSLVKTDNLEAQAIMWRDAAKQSRASADSCLRWGDREGADRHNRQAAMYDKWSAECRADADSFAAINARLGDA